MKPRCAECPLRKQGVTPVKSRMNRRSPIAIIGEAPGLQEESEKRFFVGASGWYLTKGLQVCGKTQNDARITNALLCRPKRELQPDEWYKALECCRPRLEHDLKGATHILTLGKRAWHAVSPYKDALIPWLGAPQEFDGRTVVPSIHPAYCLRGQRQYLPILYTFIDRIFKLQRGDDVFRWQPLCYYGSKRDALKDLEGIRKRKGLVGIDIETAGSDPLTAPITALGLGDRRCTVSLLWPPETHFDGDRHLGKQARDLVREILRGDSPKVCHNGAHDITGLRMAGFAIKNYAHDTLLMHHVAGNQLRHDLGFVSQVEFACDPWKKIFKVTGDAKGLARFLTAKKEELTLYNAKDTAILPRLVPRLLSRVRSEHKGEDLYRGYFQRAGIAARMRNRGVGVDHDAIWAHVERLEPKIKRSRRAVAKIAERVGGAQPFNIAALADLRGLFFDKLKQTPTAFTTKTKQGKLDAKTLEFFCASSSTVVREAARQTLLYRQYSKLKSSFLAPVLSVDESIHPTAKVWGTKTGRWSYTDPAIQTVPPEMRDVFSARDGMWIVQADYSQLELRIVALLAGDEEMLAWYRAGVDVHQQNANLLFNKPKASSELRDLAKRFVYGCNYGGEAGTIWASLVPKYPTLTLSDVSRMMNRWKTKRKAITVWQQKLVRNAQTNDFVEAPLSGRREYFHGQPEVTKILNYPIQATAADIIDAALPHVWYSLRGMKSWLLFQVHDALIAETPNPRECAKRMTRHMSKTVTLNNMRCKFPIDFKIGRAWGGDTKKFETWEEIPRAV